MLPRISITNQQRTSRFNRKALRLLTGWLMKKAAAMDPSRTWVECSVVLVGDHRMTALNRESLGHEGTTDVITFSYPTLPGEKPSGWRAEVVVNIERAVQEGRARRGGPAREFALYLAHGCQHLGGANDHTATARAAMNRRQNRWLKEPKAQELIESLAMDCKAAAADV